MYEERQLNLLKSNYNLGMEFYNNKEYEKALKYLLKTYKISNKTGYNNYTYEIATTLKEVCYFVSLKYLNEGKRLIQSSAYTTASNNLNKARKIAKIGLMFESPFKQSTKISLLIPNIEEVIETNDELIKERRFERVTKFKDGCSHVVESVGDFLSETLEIFDEILDSTNDENSSSTENDESTSQAETEAIEYYNKASAAYDKGSALYEYKACYEIAHKNNLTELENDACEAIAEIYNDLGCECYNNGISNYNAESFESAKSNFKDAERYFEKAKDWVPENCESFLKEIKDNISDARMSYNDADFEFHFGDE